MKNKYVQKTLVAVATMMFLVGCVPSKVAKENQYVGFLSDYENLQVFKLADRSSILGWINPETTMGTYEQLLIEPVLVYPGETTEDKRISVEVKQEISDYLTMALKDNLSQGYQLTEEPGPGVARISVALTRFDTRTEGLRVFELGPAGLGLATLLFISGFRDRDVFLFAEAEIRDSVTGESLARGVRKGKGKDLATQRTKLKLENVQPVLDSWAATSQEMVDAVFHRERLPDTPPQRLVDVLPPRDFFFEPNPF